MFLILCIWLTVLPAFTQTDCVQPSRFAVGDAGMVTPGAANNVRTEPDTASARVGSLKAGDLFTVLSAPVCDDTYSWLQVQADDLVGWTVEADADDYWVQPVTGEIYADDSIRLMIPEALAEDVTFEILPEVDGMGGIRPVRQYLTLKQEGDDGTPRFPLARLIVAPVVGLTEDWMPLGAEAIDELRLLLYEAPQFEEMILESVDMTIPARDLWFPSDPFILGARRMLVVLPHYVDMENGRGVAFITMYAQDLLPVTKENVFYNFVGLTDDEQYLVTMQYPVDSDMLIGSMDDFVFPENWEEVYTVYMQQATESLHTVLPEEWRPSLNTLDAVVNSIYVTGGFENEGEN